jgi:hypothetical protein
MEETKTLAEAQAMLAAATEAGEAGAIARAKSLYHAAYTWEQEERRIAQERAAFAYQMELQRLREQGRAAERTAAAVRHGRPEPQTRYERRQLDIIVRRERRSEAPRGRVRAEQTGA